MHDNNTLATGGIITKPTLVDIGSRCGYEMILPLRAADVAFLADVTSRYRTGLTMNLDEGATPPADEAPADTPPADEPPATPADEVTPPAEPEAPAAPAAPVEETPPAEPEADPEDEPDTSTPWSDPAVAETEIKRLRREAATFRTKAKANDGAAERLAEVTTELEVTKAAIAANANVGRLLDSRSFLSTVKGLTEASAITDAIKAALEADPSLKTGLAPGRSTNDGPDAPAPEAGGPEAQLSRVQRR